MMSIFSTTTPSCWMDYQPYYFVMFGFLFRVRQFTSARLACVCPIVRTWKVFSWGKLLRTSFNLENA